MEYKVKKGDLLKQHPKTVIAHCIAEDAIMGAGIAKQIRHKFNVSAIDNKAKNNELKIGRAYLSDGIIYLVTKKSSYGKPTREDFNRTLDNFKELLIQEGIKEVAIPKIGSGLDRLSWDVTVNEIEKVFKDTDIKITVYVL